MQVVIDMSEKEYNYYKDASNFYGYSKLREIVLNGIPLPQNHGDLKDMNDLCSKSNYGCFKNCNYLHTCNLYDAPTIVKADEGDNND